MPECLSHVRRPWADMDAAYAAPMVHAEAQVPALPRRAGQSEALRRAQHQFRDVHALAAHISFSFDVAVSRFGRIAPGLPNENPIP
jgi:hypothetical protein